MSLLMVVRKSEEDGMVGNAMMGIKEGPVNTQENYVLGNDSQPTTRRLGLYCRKRSILEYSHLLTILLTPQYQPESLSSCLNPIVFSPALVSSAWIVPPKFDSGKN